MDLTRTAKLHLFSTRTILSFFARLREDISNLLFVRQLFKWVSDLKINQIKFALFYLDFDYQKGERLDEILRYKLGFFSIRYLGLSLLNR